MSGVIFGAKLKCVTSLSLCDAWRCSPEAFLRWVQGGRGKEGEGSGWGKKIGWAVNCLHQMRADVPCVNVAAAAAAGATGGVVDAVRDDHMWVECQGDGGANSEPVLDNDIKVQWRWW